MRSEQAHRVAQSLVGVPHDTYARRVKPAADLDLVSIELSLIAAQARAVGLASIDDNTHPAYLRLAQAIDSALTEVIDLKGVRQ